MAAQEESLEAFRGRLYGSATSTFAVCVLVVPLKLWCRMSKSGAVRLGWDDALCVLALAFATAFFFIGMLGLGQSLGKHVGVDVTIPQLTVFLEFLFPEQLLYTVCITTNKFCILTFYWRLFSVKARAPILIMYGIVATWCIGIIIAVVLSCEPIQAQWNPLIPDAKCSGLRELYLGGSVPNIITDIVLLVMPLPYVWDLNVRLYQRLMLGGIFLLGCFVSVVSIVRLTIMMRVDLASPDYTWKMKGVLLWSVVEVNVGLVCACLPSLKPAVRLLGLDRLFGGQNTSTQESGSRSRAQTPAFDDFDKPRSRKKGSSGGLFSSLAGLTKIDDEEDSFQMINKAHDLHGTVETKIGPASTIATDDASSDREGKATMISMKRDWSVLIEQKDLGPK